MRVDMRAFVIATEGNCSSERPFTQKQRQNRKKEKGKEERRKEKAHFAILKSGPSWASIQQCQKNICTVPSGSLLVDFVWNNGKLNDLASAQFWQEQSAEGKRIMYIRNPIAKLGCG